MSSPSSPLGGVVKQNKQHVRSVPTALQFYYTSYAETICLLLHTDDVCNISCSYIHFSAITTTLILWRTKIAAVNE